MKRMFALGAAVVALGCTAGILAGGGSPAQPSDIPTGTAAHHARADDDAVVGCCASGLSGRRPAVSSNTPANVGTSATIAGTTDNSSATQNTSSGASSTQSGQSRS